MRKGWGNNRRKQTCTSPNHCWSINVEELYKNCKNPIKFDFLMNRIAFFSFVKEKSRKTWSATILVLSETNHVLQLTNIFMWAVKTYHKMIWLATPQQIQHACYIVYMCHYFLMVQWMGIRHSFVAHVVIVLVCQFKQFIRSYSSCSFAHIVIIYAVPEICNAAAASQPPSFVLTIIIGMCGSTTTQKPTQLVHQHKMLQWFNLFTFFRHQNPYYYF